MKHLAVVFILIASLVSHAEVRVVPADSANGKFTVSIDAKVFNELIEVATKIPQEELDQNWQAFLSTGHFLTVISKDVKNDIYKWLIYSPYSLGQDVVLLDGQLPLPLLKSIARVYWADLQKVIELGTNAIHGSTDDELSSNSRIVYSCIIQSSQMPEADPSCQNAISLTKLSKEQFAELSEAYMRILRSGTLKFTHEYCEFYQDQDLNELQVKMTKQMNTFLDWNVGPFSSFFNKKKLASLPFFFPRKSKFNGPQFKLCRSQQFMHLSYVGNL